MKLSYRRRCFCVVGIVFLWVQFSSPARSTGEDRVLRAGMIGLDTSHVIAFTKIFNDPRADGELARVEIVAGYPGGTDLPASRDRVENFTRQLREMGIEIVETIPQLLQKVDVVLLESVDGRIHLEEALPVLAAKKPLFIDKPIAGSLPDAIAIFEAAKRNESPVWSASSIRYAPTFQEVAHNRQIGSISGCATWGPCKYQPGTPDMFFYGVHGIEGLFTIMGTGCQTVSRSSTDGTDLVVGVWIGGRIGTFRGLRSGKTDFGATVFGEKEIRTVHGASGYQELCRQIAKFFLTNEPPIAPEETIEIFTFMEAADESKRQGGIPVRMADVLQTARRKAEQKLGGK